MWVPFLEGQFPKFGMAKIVQISARFLTTFELIANISGTDLHVEHLKKT